MIKDLDMVRLSGIIHKYHLTGILIRQSRERDLTYAHAEKKVI